MYIIRLSLPSRLEEPAVTFIGEALDDLSQSYSALRENNHHKAPWVVRWVVENAPPLEILEARLALVCELHSLHFSEEEALEWLVEPLPDVNWLEHSYQQFSPFSVGSFFIYGAHCDEDAPDGQIGLQIEAATAFGSGEHGTTKGCLQALLRLEEQGHCPWNILDMGTGSGILAIAAWKLWKSPVLAVDCDDEARRVAEIHREINVVPSGAMEMSCVCGDGFKAQAVQVKKPFDLIIANILAGPLVEMAPDLAAISDENGFVVLSGILEERAADVKTAYIAQGFAVRHEIQIDEWCSFILRNERIT